jgi:Dolichyl-phosphate-mannose-protein mannosyltransferase
MTDTPPDWVSSLQGPPVEWTRTTRIALLWLVALWGVLFWATWATWGNLTIDCGRGMYVPVALLKGKMLYRDVWYPYGPLAPYFNSLLFRVFGVNLAVLYWAGALSALFSGVFLYLTGMEMGSWPAGVGAASVVQIQAFESSYMCFPLPYSFAAVYGCLTACLFLWLIVRSCKSPKLIWIFGAGCSAAVALLLKPEFGFACYATLGILIVARAARRGWISFGRDCAAILPGVTACLWVTGWMLSIHGVSFITQENIMSWPTSYFMRRYGKEWLAVTGCTITPRVVGVAALWTIGLFVAAVVANRVLRHVESDRSQFFIWAPVAILAGAVIVWFLPWRTYAVGGLRRILFPKQMVCLIAVAAGILWLRLWRERSKKPVFPLALVFTFVTLLAFRLLFGMSPWGYSIYYDGPAALCFLLLAGIVIPRYGRTRLFATRTHLLIVFSVVTVVSLYAGVVDNPDDLANRVPLVTNLGTIKVSKAMAESYTVAIDWMKSANARGQTVLSVPEDMSLYFLSGTDCPTRVIEFTPGVVAPGKMTDELVAEINAKQIPYLLWSNRQYPEYKTPVFGTDFDRELADYFRTHYRPLRALTDHKAPEWNAVIWERISDTEAQ